ncbi:MAG: ATPase [Ruminococcaceae bacterium]|nr:ATPase [Oscillospiraceae bacterium]
MDILEIIEALEEKIEHSFTIPFVGRGIVDKDALLDLLQEARIKYPEEMKQAKWVKDERQRIIADAQKEAAAIVKSTEEKMAALVTEHEVTKQAYENANQIVESAQDHAREIRLGANQYADNVLHTIEESLISTVETIRANRKDLKR